MLETVEGLFSDFNPNKYSRFLLKLIIRIAGLTNLKKSRTFNEWIGACERLFSGLSRSFKQRLEFSVGPDTFYLAKELANIRH